VWLGAVLRFLQLVVSDKKSVGAGIATLTLENETLAAYASQKSPVTPANATGVEDFLIYRIFISVGDNGSCKIAPSSVHHLGKNRCHIRL